MDHSGENPGDRGRAAPAPAGAEGDRLVAKGQVAARWAFQQLPTACALYDAEGRLLRMNTRMEQVLACSEEEVRGLRIREIQHGVIYDESDRRIRKVAATGEPEYMEPYIKVPGESVAHLWISEIFPLRNESGLVAAVGAIAYDASQQHRSRERLALLGEAQARMGKSLEVDGAARELAEVAFPSFADFVAVDLLNPVLRGDLPGPPPPGPVTLHRAVSRSAHVPPAVPDGAAHTHPATSPVARCLGTGRAERFSFADPEITHWLAGDPVATAQAHRHGAHSLVVVPIRARGTTLGVATFARHSLFPTPFTADDLIVAEDLVSRAAICLDNSRRYTRERGLALSLQRDLLPPRAGTYRAADTAGRHLPADGGQGTGGDWFDVIPLPGTRMGLVAGGVVGHGVHAAAAMGRLRLAVRTLADIDLAPDELLTHLDGIVTHAQADTDGPHGGGDVGATCLYAVYDPVTQVCSLAAAGHPAPLLVRPGSGAETVDVPAGPPLGLGSLPYEATEVRLPEGSLLALFSEGLLMMGGGREERTAALARALSRPATSPEDICDDVVDTLAAGPRTHDVALLLARTRALDSDHVASWELPSDPTVVAEARRRATGRLSTWGMEDSGFYVELVVSELVTNAIRYGADPIRLRLIRDRSLICEVSDGSDTTPHMRRAKPTDEGGRGLLLVAQLSERWGTRHTPTGKTVWAEEPVLSP
jgi:PAS domain S-box-containing protein